MQTQTTANRQKQLNVKPDSTDSNRMTVVMISPKDNDLSDNF